MRDGAQWDWVAHLRLHGHEVGHDQPGAVNEPDLRGPEEGLEVLCLGRMCERGRGGVGCVGSERTLPGVLEAETLEVPKSALRREDLPTLGWPAGISGGQAVA